MTHRGVPRRMADRSPGRRPLLTREALSRLVGRDRCNARTFEFRSESMLRLVAARLGAVSC